MIRLRVMTYNVHSCVGTDGKASFRRVAEVIARQGPDVAALQELDSGLLRTGMVEQAQAIAESLNMEYHFHPALRMEAGRFGNAILSRYPLRLFHAGELPTLPGRALMERRGALWANIGVMGREIQVLNTHLGLNRRERTAQALTLAGPEWLGHPQCRPPVIFCGDLNASPWSTAHRLLGGPLLDAHRLLRGWRAEKTWPSRFPFRRLDYLFVSPGIIVRSAGVPRDALTRAASDHLPVVAELEIPLSGEGHEEDT